MSSNRSFFLALSLPLIAAAGFLIYTEYYAHTLTGTFGFPLDDPWIHLQFARNLHDYGSYSYYKNEMVTAGSTSPLYTFLLAVGFFFTSNEFVLSYFFGILFLLAAGVVFFKIVQSAYGEHRFAPAVATAALLFEPRLQWAALSGMETTLFVFMLLLVFSSYRAKRPVLLGVSSGLLIWTRPEALLFIFIIAVDLLYNAYWVRTAASKLVKKVASDKLPSFVWLRKPLIILAVIALAYVGMNLTLSGSFFPNTFAAKIKYYSGGAVPAFPKEFARFIAGGNMIVTALAALLGLLSLLIHVAKRQKQDTLISVLWIAGMFAAYWKNLPYLIQEGRYMMPVLPFLFLLALEGIRLLLSLLKKIVRVLHRQESAVAIAVVLLFIAGLNGAWTWESRTSYAESCKYITDRQVTTAHWIHEHLPEGAVVGTHDIGAIGYYSGRRIADMVGLVSPAMIESIGSLDKLQQFLIEQKVTHIAVLRNWFEVTNQNSLFQTNERDFEIMEVFEFDKVRTHFTPSEAGNRTNTALRYLSQNNVQSAGTLLAQAVMADPNNSKTHFELGIAYFVVSKLDDAERELVKAIDLHKDYWDAELTLAQVMALRGHADSAMVHIERIVERNPSYAPAYRVLADLYSSARKDTLRAREMMNKYAQLTQEGPAP